MKWDNSFRHWVCLKIWSNTNEDTTSNDQKSLSSNLDMPIENLEFSLRTSKGLFKEKIETVAQLTSLTEHQILRIRNLGTKNLDEIKEVLEKLGLKLQG